MGPLTHRFFPVNTYTTVKVFSPPHDILNICFSLVYIIIKIQHTIHIIYKICINQLFMFIGKALVNSRLLVTFWGNQKLRVDIQLCGKLAPLNPMLVKSQLYPYT